jgi:hypothetical protein
MSEGTFETSSNPSSARGSSLILRFGPIANMEGSLRDCVRYITDSPGLISLDFFHALAIPTLVRDRVLCAS